MSSRAFGPYNLSWRGSPESLTSAGRIVTLKFSPNGDYIASGTENGLLCIWSVSLGEEIQRRRLATAITALEWHPSFRTVVIYGTADGDAEFWNFRRPQDPRCEILTGIIGTVHAYDLNPKKDILAIAIDEEVQIAKTLPDSGRWATFSILPRPSTTAVHQTWQNIGVEPRGVHFLHHGQSLIVSYADHGIVCWDIGTNTELWVIDPPAVGGTIGCSALSSDERFILTSNLGHGVDIFFAAPQALPLRRFRYGVPSTMPHLSVGFASGGETVVGSPPADGDVTLFERDTGIPLQVIHHPGRRVTVIACATHKKQSLIATASLSSQDVYVDVFKADQVRQAPEETLRICTVRWISRLTWSITEYFIEVGDVLNTWVADHSRGIVMFIIAMILIIIAALFVDTDSIYIAVIHLFADFVTALKYGWSLSLNFSTELMHRMSTFATQVKILAQDRFSIAVRGGRLWLRQILRDLLLDEI